MQSLPLPSFAFVKESERGPLVGTFLAIKKGVSFSVNLPGEKGRGRATTLAKGATTWQSSPSCLARTLPAARARRNGPPVGAFKKQRTARPSDR